MMPSPMLLLIGCQDLRRVSCIRAALLSKMARSHAAVQAAHRVVEFSAASAPIEGLNVIDVAHNIGATANAVVKALTILRDNMGADLIDLFTRPQNTPTPNVRLRIILSSARPILLCIYHNTSLRPAGQQAALTL